MNLPSDTTGTRPRRSLLEPRRVGPVLGLILVAGIILAARDFDILATLGAHRAAIVAWAESHLISAVLLYVLTYVAVIVLSLPGAFAMTMTGGFLFGFLPGAMLSALSATAGGLVVFLIARTALGAPVRAWLLGRAPGSRWHAIERGLRENAIIYLLLLRLIPAVPFTLANVAPAFFGVSPRVFAATTFIGVMPASAIMASIGVGLGEIFDRGERPDLSLFTEPQILWPLLGLGALALLPLLLRRGRLSAL
jgi:uncharacterized membrane protein YdjX (TVP38/TMEM64 family)